jgi:isocitrate lyase
MMIDDNGYCIICAKHENQCRCDEEEPTSSGRWEGINRDWTVTDVNALRGRVKIEYSLAAQGSRKLWNFLNQEEPVAALGALTGNQAVQQVKAGLNGIYVSGWQVAADANLSGQTYPDQSLYPANSVPTLVKRINQSLQRADQIESSEGIQTRDWMVPVIADAEAGFGGPLNAYEMMKSMIESGVAGVHFEDQLSSEKKCGHLGGKVLLPTSQFIRTLKAARLAADVMDVPTVLIARTDANSAKLITSDIDPRDHEFLTGSRTSEGFYRITGGIDCAIARGLAYAPYADMLWCETSTPNIEEAQKFADAIHEKFPGKLLAYNCSPSFNWRKHLDEVTISTFRQQLNKMGYKFQFVTLAGFHSLNHSMFELSRKYKDYSMSAYVELQDEEFMSEHFGYTATKHQREVGTGYFDSVKEAIMGDDISSTLALKGSTESDQFD